VTDFNPNNSFMNSRNVKAIKTKQAGRTLTYEVVYLLRKNDLRFSVPDKRRMTKDNLGDGWREEHDTREVLNEHVDDFIANLDRRGIEHTLLFEQDLQEA
jgi:hypothetical protein